MRGRCLLYACLGACTTLTFFCERDAAACGGCVQPVVEVESVITDEKMILSISKDQTTLYDEIEYSGSPSSFAWVLPIKGQVAVGLSADILFEAIDQLTATQVVAPTPNCPAPDCVILSGYTEGTGDDAGGGLADSGVTVTSKKQVGPYETVQLHSNDGSALNHWLVANGYVLPSTDAPVIAAYVADKFDFLALKLLPGAGVQTMQPVRVTTKGASPSLPLQMVAVGTGATTGITIWVVADGRWEPQNFPTFTIADSELVWDWTTNSSNYESLRLSKEASFGGRGWQVESSLDLSQYTIHNTLVSNLTCGSDAGIYAPLGSDGGDAGIEGGPVPLDSGDGDVGACGAPEGAAAAQDLAVLFAGIAAPNVRITRMRSDVAHSALSVDMILKASADQSELTNLHYLQKTTGPQPCPSYEEYCGYPQEAGYPGNYDYGLDNGGCSTTGSSSETGITVASILGFIGASAIGARRRRRHGTKT
jgi:Uncharacterized protein conserved in bacteria (DUF2330)